MTLIITHTNPDWDAITGVWLLERYGGFDNAEVAFVNTGNPDQELLEKADAVVDTGKVWDTIRCRFDHHHLPGQQANDTCATKQVFDYVWSYRYDLAGGMDTEIEHLRPLVDLIFAGDTGRPEANASREIGLHALLSGYKAWYKEQNPPNEILVAYGFGLLDVLDVRLRQQAVAKAELAEKAVYKSEDGLVWAIKGSTGSTFAAYEEGARIVVFEGEPIEVDGGTTYPVGIMRAGEWQEPHVGNLAEAVGENPLFTNEIGKWFKHPAGFFAGKGTPKAPVFEPPDVELVALAKAIDAAWIR